MAGKQRGPRRVFFVSLGCPKNTVDSEVMLGELARAGHLLVPDAADADAIVVNTCGFIDAAKEESIDTILEMAEHKTSGKCQTLVVTGCLTQRYPNEVAAEIPEIDHILGSADFNKLAGVLGRQRGGATLADGKEAHHGARTLPIVDVDDTPKALYDHNSPRVLTGNHHSVYLKIAEGCDRPCAFCIIPKLRGPQRSRPIDSIMAEAERLVAGGAKEINLVAQDLTRYGWDIGNAMGGVSSHIATEVPTLARLLRELCTISDLDWIRMHYTYPTAITDELIEVVASEDKVCSYIDVPLQHIDDQVLKRMRRGHSARVTHELIARLRDRIDDVVLRTTFIVGHPGETEESYANLRRFVRDTRFDRVGVFTYSQEPGTVSALLPGRVPIEIADQRQAELLELQRQISRQQLDSMIGTEISVLVDGGSEESEFLLEGRYYGQAPGIDGVVYLTDGEAQIGDLVRAQVTTASDYDLAASLAGQGQG